VVSFLAGAERCAVDIADARFMAVDAADHRTVIGRRSVRECIARFLATA